MTKQVQHGRGETGIILGARQELQIKVKPLTDSLDDIGSAVPRFDDKAQQNRQVALDPAVAGCQPLDERRQRRCGLGSNRSLVPYSSDKSQECCRGILRGCLAEIIERGYYSRILEVLNEICHTRKSIKLVVPRIGQQGPSGNIRAM